MTANIPVVQLAERRLAMVLAIRGPAGAAR